MSIQIELQDYAGRKITFDELSKRAKRILVKQTKERCWEVLNEGAINVRNNIIQGMRNSPPTGKLYFRGMRSVKGKTKPVFHRASSPGNYPRVDSGGLVQSIHMSRGIDEIEVGSRITSPAYPVFLEKGTDTMEARPWLEPSFDKEELKIKRRLQMVLRRAASDYVRGNK